MKWLSKILKLDFSKNEDKLKFFIMASGLLIVIIASSVTAIGLTMRPDFCKTCHVMQPEYVTWKATSHANISCTDCHIEPGLVSLVKHKVGAMKELYHYATGTYETPLKMAKPVSNVNCERCHSVGTRNFTVSGDLIIPHTQHINSKLVKINCVDCHAGVAHGRISGRGVINTEDKAKTLHDGDLKAWTEKDGQQQTNHEYTKTDMDECIACHVKVRNSTGKGKPSINCETCHSTIKTPDNHNPKDQWLPIHGKDAQKDINVCKSCHSYGMKVNNVDLVNKVVAYAWGNEYCNSCHSTLPTSHKKKDWRQTHKFDVRSKGAANCQACHSVGAIKGNVKPPAGKTCSQCH